MGKVFEGELCIAWNTPAHKLRSWSVLIPCAGEDLHPIRDVSEPYYENTEQGFAEWKQWSQILNAGCTVSQLQELIAKDNKTNSNLVETYSSLAKDCSEGITPHILRSYCIIIMLKKEKDKNVFSKELAEIADISQKQALDHLYILQYNGLLKFRAETLEWEYNYIPRILIPAMNS